MSRPGGELQNENDLAVECNYEFALGRDATQPTAVATRMLNRVEVVNNPSAVYHTDTANNPIRS